MASPSLLRSAVGRVLRRSYLQGPSPRSPRVFFSGVAGRIGPCKVIHPTPPMRSLGFHRYAKSGDTTNSFGGNRRRHQKTPILLCPTSPPLEEAAGRCTAAAGPLRVGSPSLCCSCSPSTSPQLPSHAEGERICRLEMVLDLFQAHLRQTQALIDFLLEEEKRSQRSEQLQKKIACVLVPATAALYIFGPDKKEKSPAEGQSSM